MMAETKNIMTVVGRGKPMLCRALMGSIFSSCESHLNVETKLV